MLVGFLETSAVRVSPHLVKTVRGSTRNRTENNWVYLGVKSRKSFLCFVAIF